MASWDELVQSAFTGTQRRPLEAHHADPLSAQVYAKFQENPARALLAVAYIHSVRRAAGFLPPTLEASSEAWVNHIRDADVAKWLLEVLNRYPIVGREYLDLLRQANLLLPEESLPEIMDFALQQGIEDIVYPIVGERGMWLAHITPRWNHLFITEASWAVWADYTHFPQHLSREAMFARLRRADAKRAMDFLAQTWRHEAPAQHQRLLSVLWNELSATDEPFLENLLDHIEEPLRSRVVSLLARLPESRFAERMIERARSLIHVGQLQAFPTARLSPTSPAPRQLQATEPVLQAEWARDGLVNAANNPLLQRTAWRGSFLYRLVSYVPPSRWCELLGLSPQEIIAAADLSTQYAALLGGLLSAAQSYRDEAWLLAFWEWGIMQTGKPHFAVQLRNVLTYLPHAQREACLIRLFEHSARPFAIERQGIGLMDQLTETWSVPFSRAFVAELQQAAHDVEVNQMWSTQPRRHPTQSGNYLQELFKQFGRYLAPQILPELAKLRVAMADDPLWADFLDQLCAILRFRQQMHQTFRKDLQ